MTNVIFNHLTPDKVLDENSHRDQREVFAYFTEYLRRYEAFSDADLQGLDRYWNVCLLKKNELLFSEKEVLPELSFIARGAVKIFKESSKGPQILALLTEANFTAQKKVFCSREPAPYNALCVEPAILVSIDCDNLKKLLEERPVFVHFFFEQNENIIQFLQQRLTSFQQLSAQERYEELLTAMPDIINRFTLTDVANYLGMKGETLSRVRSSLSKKDMKIAS